MIFSFCRNYRSCLLHHYLFSSAMDLMLYSVTLCITKLYVVLTQTESILRIVAKTKIWRAGFREFLVLSLTHCFSAFRKALHAREFFNIDGWSILHIIQYFASSIEQNNCFKNRLRQRPKNDYRCKLLLLKSIRKTMRCFEKLRHLFLFTKKHS